MIYNCLTCNKQVSKNHSHGCKKYSLDYEAGIN